MNHDTTLIATLKRTCLAQHHQMKQLEQLAIAQNEVLIKAGSVACAAMWDLVFANPGVEMQFPSPSDAEVLLAFQAVKPPSKIVQP